MDRAARLLRRARCDSAACADGRYGIFFGSREIARIDLSEVSPCETRFGFDRSDSLFFECNEGVKGGHRRRAAVHP